MSKTIVAPVLFTSDLLIYLLYLTSFVLYFT